MSGSLPGPKGFTPCQETYSITQGLHQGLVHCGLPEGHRDLGSPCNDGAGCEWYPLSPDLPEPRKETP